MVANLHPHRRRLNHPAPAQAKAALSSKKTGPAIAPKGASRS